MDQKLYDKGLEIRTAVMGKAYVDKALAANADDFGGPVQAYITEHAWGAIWGREGLSRKTRSMLNLAMLAILNRPHELRGHIRGALNNGATPEEIMGVFHHATVYCGFPAANGAVRAGAEVFKELGLI